MIGMFTALSGAALACGGFFCNQTEPVVQNAERIVFAVDEVAQQVEVHVQVEYEGPADEFAWIVPVKSQPEIFLTNELLFQMVGQQLQPSYQLAWQEEGECRYDNGGLFGWGRGAELAADSAADPVPPAAPEDEDGVTVVAAATVGPYDTVTLQATDLESLVTWLRDNDYDIPMSAEAAIAPYISADGYFVALKLVKGSDAGDLSPLGMRYSGTSPSVPIQLTSVAAADDLRLEVSVFSGRRAVPDNYLHVKLNEAAIDWFQGGTNLNEVITRAADEAGGHAFATDYAGTTDVLWAEFAIEPDLQALSASTTPTAWIETLQSQGFRGTSDMLTFFEFHFPVADGFEPVDVYNCPSCYTGWYAGPTFNAPFVTDAFNTRIVEPREAIQDLIDTYPYVTRLTSSLSASEMTIDPMFTFNDGIGDVDRWHTADLVHECNGRQIMDATRRLELPDGRVIQLPSMQWFQDQGITESEYLSELGSVNAVVIEATSSEGAPNVIADFTDQVADQVNRFNETAGAAGCGCQSAPTYGVLPTVFVALLGVIGRRRR